MAIVRMNKFTLIALKADKKNILKKLQTFGEAQFINLQSKRLNDDEETLKLLKEDTLDSSSKAIEENLSRLKSSIKFLKNYVPKDSALKSLKEGKVSLSYEDLKEYGKEENFLNLCKTLRGKEERLAEIDNKISKLDSEVELIRPWQKLDAAFSDLKNTKNTNYFLGTVPNSKEGSLKSEFEKFNLSNIEIINSDGRFSYILVLCHKDEAKDVLDSLKLLEFAEFKADYNEKAEVLLKSFNSDLSSLKEEQNSIVDDLKTRKEDMTKLERAHEYFENRLIRLKSSENFLNSDSTIIISGWFPKDKKETFKSFIKTLPNDNYFYNIYEVTEEDIDDVPIKLKNNTLVKSFESLTEMYSLPKYDGIDPTPILTPFYIIFFGMMVADVAYGLIVAFAGFFALKKFNLDEKKRNFIRMFTYLGISTTVWGFIYGSVFGDAIKIPGLINPNKDIYTIVFLSIGFGAVQILTGLCVKAYVLIKAGEPWAALFDSGSWIITLISVGLFLGAGMAEAKYTMIAGMLLIVLTNGREAKSIGGKLGSGLYALYGITSYIGDLVSYTRLMALGISGGSIAGAMNIIIGYFPGISLFIIGPVVFIAVHIFNMLLGLLGAYVHDLRLQYVEFFGKFYSGGGKPFSPFKMINKYINIKDN